MCLAERDFLIDKGLKASTQGMSVFTADGKLLATGGGFDALTQGEFYESLKRRMLRTLSYVFAGDVKSLDITLRNGRLTGTFQSDTGDTGTLQGFIESRHGKVTRFDVIAKGIAERVSDC